MEVYYLARGIAIGFSIAAPVGPIGMLCIRRSLSQGIRSGLMTGVGAATADACYGCIAGFGLTYISSLLLNEKFWLQLVGGVFLCFLGVTTLVKDSSQTSLSRETRGLWLAFISSFFLTITNPITILSFAAIFAAVGVVSAPNGYVSSANLVAGVFLGSMLWWVFLSGSLTLVRRKLSPRIHRWLNRVSGGILLFFGIASLGDVLFSRIF